MFDTALNMLRDLVPFVPFKKRGKRPWRSVTFNKIAWTFFTFLKLYKCYQIAQSITNKPLNTELENLELLLTL